MDLGCFITSVERRRLAGRTGRRGAQTGFPTWGAFAQFPHRLGEPVRLHWHPATGIERALRGTFTLRCVEEWFERTEAGENASASLVQEEIWSGTWHLDTLYLFTPGEVVDLHFEPPAGLPPTHLGADMPVFWEFEVKLDLPGLDFEEVYLVPVYAAP